MAGELCYSKMVMIVIIEGDKGRTTGGLVQGGRWVRRLVCKIFQDKVSEVGKLWSTATNVCIWDWTSLPTGHLWTQNGSDLQPNFTLSVHKGIRHKPILGPISIQIWIGHISEYIRVLWETLLQLFKLHWLALDFFQYLTESCSPVYHRWNN